MRLLAAYLATGLTFGALDAVWLSQVGPGLYRPTLDEVLRPTDDPLNLSAAILFYLAYVAGVLALAVWPNRNTRLSRTSIAGAVLGAMCYATYDLTNQATLKVWATQITVLDVLWGAFVTAVGATAGGLAVRRLSS